MHWYLQFSDRGLNALLNLVISTNTFLKEIGQTIHMGQYVIMYNHVQEHFLKQTKHMWLNVLSSYPKKKKKKGLIMYNHIQEHIFKGILLNKTYGLNILYRTFFFKGKFSNKTYIFNFLLHIIIFKNTSNIQFTEEICQT